MFIAVNSQLMITDMGEIREREIPHVSTSLGLNPDSPTF